MRFGFFGILVGASFFLVLEGAAFPQKAINGWDWQDPELWKSSAEHSVEFFNRNAWQSACEGYLTRIDQLGNRLPGEQRGIVSLSRMLYGLAHSAEMLPHRRAEYLRRAQGVADFILQKMVRRDALGEYFLPIVDSSGRALDAEGNRSPDPEVLLVQEQAYGLNGLVGLYQATRDERLLLRIRDLYASFYRRFHDTWELGFFDQFDRKAQQAIPTKSYNSTVYVATSFLMELAEVDVDAPLGSVPPYSRTIRELGDLVSTHFYDPNTGWLVENFDLTWRPDWRGWQKQSEGTVGVVGHNFQAAWFLMRLAQSQWAGHRSDQYLHSAKQILDSMLTKPVTDEARGGFYDVFVRETDRSIWHTNKAWWQQAIGILALTLAERSGLFGSEPEKLAAVVRIRDEATQFYFEHFIDREHGGEFPEVTEAGQALPDKLKGDYGKSAYHTVELARYMLRYGQAGRRPQTRTALSEAPRVQPRSRYDNPVKTALQSGQIVYGGFLMTPSAENAERLAERTHFVWIDAEHGSFSPQQVLDIVTRFHLTTPAIPVLRVPSWNEAHLKPYLDTGVLGIVVPEIQNAEQVRQFLRKVKYPPEGDRGFGPARSTGYLDPKLSQEAVENANRQLLVVVMIETPEAVQNIDEIASVPGIDVLHIGPYDLALKMGGLALDDPRVLAAVKKVENTARKHHLPLGSATGSRQDAQQKSMRGYQFFTLPSDQELIRSGLNRLIDEHR